MPIAAISDRLSSKIQAYMFFKQFWLVFIAHFSLVAECGLESAGSVAVAHGLSCPVTCGILVP